MQFILLTLTFLPLFEISDTIYSFANLENLFSNFQVPYNYTIKTMSFSHTPVYSNLFIFRSYNIQSPSIGGTSPEENMVLFQGIPLVNPMLGYQELSIIPSNLIRSAEILHSSSALSGLAGIGGAINYIPSEMPFELRFSQLKKQLKFGIAPHKNFSITFSHESFTDSFPIKYEGLSLWAKNTHDEKIGLLVKLKPGNILIIKRKAGAPGPLGSLLSGERYELLAGSNFNLPINKFNFQFSSTYTSQTYTTPGTSDLHKTFFLRGVIKKEHLEAGTNLHWSNSTKIGKHLIPEIWGSLNFKRKLVKKAEILANLNLIYNLVFKILSLNPSISLSNPIYPGLYNFLTISLNHRNPTMNELYWPEDNFARGNPELKPEKSINVDLGFRKISPKFYINLFGFFKKINNGILWIQEDKYVPKNYALLTHTGIGLEAVFKPWKDLIYAEFELNLQSSKLNTTPFIYRPNFTFSSRIATEFGKIEFCHIGKRPERPNSPKMLPPVWIINFSIEKGFKFSRKSIFLRAGIENLLNVNYEILRGYPNPGRELFVEISKNRGM